MPPGNNNNNNNNKLISNIFTTASNKKILAEIIKPGTVHAQSRNSYRRIQLHFIGWL
jgi:hypothetical protein